MSYVQWTLVIYDEMHLYKKGQCTNLFTAFLAKDLLHRIRQKYLKDSYSKSVIEKIDYKRSLQNDLSYWT